MQSAAALARMKAEKGNPQIDMYQFSGGQEHTAKKEGLTQPLQNVSRLAKIPAGLKDPDGNWVTWAVIAEGIVTLAATGSESKRGSANDGKRKLLHQKSPFFQCCGVMQPLHRPFQRNHIRNGSASSPNLSMTCLESPESLSWAGRATGYVGR